MGGGGKGGTSTSTVSIPPEVLARYNAVNARAEEVAKKPFEAYTGEFVAPITEEQQQGISQTQKYSEAAQPYYARAAGMTEDAYNASQPLTSEQIQQYQNPYIQSVVDPTLKALQQQQGIDRQTQAAQAIRSGAFGGERAGLQRAVLGGQQELAQAQAISPLYADAYKNALATAAQQQAQRVSTGLAAGQQTAGIGTTAQKSGLEGGQAVIGAGTLKQQTTQALDTAKYQQFLQERGYDFQTAQFLANIAMGTGALTGSTTTTTQPTSFFSDERLKHDIKQIGKTNDGQPIYSFKYKGDNRTQIGLLAQEVEKKHPEAVGLSGGYKTVDYAKATASSRHARAMGGLVPESMGGAVYEPGNFSRGGFAYGGDPEDLKAILAQQSKSFGPFASGGLYGASAQQNPHGNAAGYVPKATLHTPKLLTSNFQPRQQQGEFQSALQNINAAGKAAETLSGDRKSVV
jgi:SOS response regulatory protein OraA/RecX